MCYKNISPSKKLRSLKRLAVFQQRKMSTLYKAANPHKILSISTQQTTSILPLKPKLSITTLPSFYFPSKCPEKPKLSFKRNDPISISPKPIYHPAIIKACQAICSKHPDHLSPEETLKFNHYRNWKLQNGEPLEEDIVYLPTGGLRTCLACGQLT